MTYRKPGDHDMSEIRTYVLVNEDDEYVSDEFDTLDEAKNEISFRNEAYAIVSLVYTFEDSELVWTPDGGNVWPPRKS
jgi:hypothetical protein